MSEPIYSSGSGTKSDPYVLNSSGGTITLSPGKYYVLPKGATIGNPGSGNNDASGGVNLNGANLELARGSQANGIIDVSTSGSNLLIDAPKSPSDMVQTTYNPGKGSVGGTWTYPQTQNAAINGLITDQDKPNNASSVVAADVPTTNDKKFGIVGTYEYKGSRLQGSEFVYNSHYTSPQGNKNQIFGYEVLVPRNSSVVQNQTTMVVPHTQAGNGDYVVGNTDSHAYVCFLAGSMIRLADGAVRAVEDIVVGDVLETVLGAGKGTASVTWTGSRFVWTKGTLPADQSAFPVVVKENAIAQGIPSQDLHITSEHCLFIDGGYVPVRMLVNGGSIAYDMSVDGYYYYHVETEKHSIIFANDCMTESYLDTGNRAGFVGSDTVVPFKAKTWGEDAAAPLLVSPDCVSPIHSRLAARARLLGFETSVAGKTTTDDDLKLVSDNGMTIRPLRRAGKTVLFHIPSGATQLAISSNANRPADVIGPFYDDRRVLGVKIGRASVMVDGEGAREISVESLARASGWHVPEANGIWTNGYAALDLREVVGHATALLMLDIVEAGPYLEVQDSLDLVSRRKA